MAYDYFVAFQGGGKKGTSYSGVFETLKKFKNKIKNKGIIGTSVGCQYGLFFMLDFSL
jgi:hypothetical protein